MDELAPSSDAISLLDGAGTTLGVISLIGLELENENELVVDKSEEGRGGVVCRPLDEPGIEITEAVSVAVEVMSSSLRAVCPTGVKALVSLFWSWRERG